MNPLLRLRPYLRPHLGLLIGSVLLAIPLAALRFSPVPLIKYLVDDLLVSRDERKLLLFPAIFVGLFALNFVVRFLHYYFIRLVMARVDQRLKNNLYRHLMGLSADYFTAQSVGALVSRVGSDSQYIGQGVSSINVLVREPLTFLFLFGYALYLDWKLTLITLAVFPPLAWVFSATGRSLKRYVGRMTEENAKLYGTMQESFSGFRVIKMFGLEQYGCTKFQEKTENFARWQLKGAAVEEASHPMVELLTAFAVAAVIYYGGSQVLNGEMTSGDLLAFFTAFGMMLHPIRLLNDASIKLHTASAACARIFELFDWKPTLKEAADPIHISGFKEEIRLRQVEFAYPDAPERKVLNGISFAVPKGEVVALVGASGAGKSSLVSLLPRIFDPVSGVIEIDGIDIRKYALKDLRSLIAVVSQDVFLFNDTIEENIRCGRLDASFEEIKEAAKRANALGYIESLPQGFKTVIGDRGQKLSGGERQRLSIARAFLRTSPILILDEATSSLDTASERAVQAALEELMKDRTTIVIAHRLSTIRNANQILVLKQGQVVESGRHEELVARAGEYARFHQFGEVQG